MSNGGYKGASPARETSPEQYPGVWELTEQFQAQADGNWPFQETDCAPKSLRFDGSSSYLSKTPAQAGNKRTWTFSFWVKRCDVDSTQVIWMVYNSAIDEANYASISFTSTGQLRVGWAYDTYKTTTARYRDPSAWMHCCVSVDTNHAVASERVQIAINGIKQTEFAGSHDPDLGQELAWNGAYLHHLGSEIFQQYSNNYLSEVQFVDGQQLSCEEFGFFDGQGIWQPKRFTGDYSSGPVYSAYLTSSGTFATTSEGPDKAFDGIATDASRAKGSQDNILTFDISSFGFTGLFELWSQNTGAEFSIDGGSNWSAIGDDVWTTVSSDISGVSTIQMRPASGATMKVSAFKSQGQLLIDTTVGRNSFHLDFSDGVKDQSGLGNDWTANNITFAPNKSQNWTSNVTGGASAYGAKANAFDGDLTTYASPESGSAMVYTNPSASDTVINSFEIYGRQFSSSITLLLNGTDIKSQFSSTVGWHTITGFEGQNFSSLEWNATSGNLECRIYAIRINGSTLVDSSITNDPVTSAIDFFVDSPVNGNEVSTGAGGERRGNYATLSPLTGAQTLSNGNLDVTGGSSWQRSVSTIAMSSGKWYWEYKITASNEHIIGVGPLDMQMSGNLGAGSPPGSGYGTELGQVNGTGANSAWNNNGQSTTGDLIGVAFDADAGNMYIYKNGAVVNNGTPSHTGLTNGPYYAVFSLNGSSRSGSVNFGQHPFAYQNTGIDRPSSDYKPLTTSFLPEPSELAKNPSKAFDILLWSGNGGNNNRTITGIDMESGPDMVWSKTRNHTYHNNIFDAVRGFGTSGGAPLTTDYISGQANAGVIKSTDSTSITWEKDSQNGYVWYNESGKDYVSWLWDAGTTTTTIAAGGSNSLAYDQSQTWSGLWSTTGTTYGSAAALHDATVSTASYFQIQGSGTFTLPSALPVTSLRFYTQVYGTGGTVSVNGTDVTSQLQSSGIAWREITGFTSLSTISVTGTDGNNLIGWYAIELNGKKLIDNGVTVANVPGAACDVRANPEAGFSIVKVDSPNSTEARVHGLSKAPDFIIAKATASNQTQHYHMFHSHFGKSHYAVFNPDAWASSDQWGSQEPDATSFYVKTNTGSGANYAGGMIYYIWHAVENYSAMSSYVGNGLADGPMVHLGWEPKWLMIKGTGSSKHWRIYDATREPFNEKNLTLHASNAYTETNDASDEMDFLSNGFKIRSTGSFHNSQDQTYLYVAFAANPFASNIRAH